MIWVITGVVFLAFLAGLCSIGNMLMSDKLSRLQTMRQRLAMLGPQESQVNFTSQAIMRDQSLSSIPLLHRFLSRIPRTKDISLLLYQAGRPFNLGTLVLMCMTCATLGLMLGSFKQSLILAIVLAFVGSSMPILYLKALRKRRLKIFDEQFPEAVDMIARSLRAGHSFGAALKMVSEEMDDPLAKEFEKTFEEYSYGKGMVEALIGLVNRVGLKDVKFFTTAVTLQRETGGNLTEILDNIGHIVRERFRLLRQVRALSAEGRLSGVILCLMPPALLVLLWIVSPKYIQYLTDHPMGQTLLMLAGAFQLLGMLVIKKLVTLKV